MKMRTLALSFALVSGVAFGRGYVPWSGVEPHPAVVNPVCGNEPGSVVSLNGEWEFMARPYAADRQQFFRKTQFDAKWPNSRKINVPGSWEEQGVGEAVPQPGRVCYGGVSKAFPLAHSFVGNGWYRRTFDVPAEWSGKRIFLKVGGVGCQGWFWVNDHPVAHVYDYCATRKYEITGFVKPGEAAKIVAEASNAAPSKHGTFEAYGTWGGLLRSVEVEAVPQTFIDDAWVRGDFDKRTACVKVEVEGGRWKEEQRNGRKSSVQPSTSDLQTFLLRATVEGETVEVKVKGEEKEEVRSKSEEVRNVSNSTVQPSTFNLQPIRSSYSLEVPLRHFRPWSPEHPNLYTAKVELVSADGKVLQTRFERFGVRKLEVRGKDFYLNGRKFFFRGVGFHEIDPIHGFFPADREYCRERIAKCRAAGFNIARLHTRCEWPEFFEVCDELGLMLQPELPYYGDFIEGNDAFEPIEDARELWENYRRHPSFAVYCGGNEGSFGPVLGPVFYRTVRAMDPDRLVIEQDTMAQSVWKRSPDPAGKETWRGVKMSPADDLAKYRVSGCDDFVAFPSKIWPRGLYDPPCPLIAHEYLNLSVKGDTRLEPEYVGVWDHPVKRSVRGEWLARFGLDHAWGDRLQDAQHALQAIWQKIGIEAARKDPCCDGYHFWSLIDCTFANEKGWTGVLDLDDPAYMAQGLFDPFCREKANGQTARGFAVFNSPSGVFIDANPSNLQLVAGAPFAFDVLFADYEEADRAPASRVAWKIVASDGATLASGEKAVGTQPFGGVRTVASFKESVPAVVRPTVAELKVAVLTGEGKLVCANGWPCWLFPVRAKRDGRDLAVVGPMAKAFGAAYDGVLPAERAAEAKVVVAPAGDPVVGQALARGQSVVEIGGLEGELNVSLSWWFMSGMTGAIFETADPILRYLPESKTLSTLHFRLVKQGLRLPVPGFPPERLAAVSEEGKGCYAHLGSRVDRRGGRHLFAYGLALDSGDPEALAVLDGLVDRARTPVTTDERATATESGSVVEKPIDQKKSEGANVTTGGAGRL